MSRPRAIALLSGGLDSTTLVYLLALADHAGESHQPQKNQPSVVRGTYGLARAGYDLHVLLFDYGQRHKKELAYAARTAQHLGLHYDVVDLSSVAFLLKGSSLTDEAIAVPDGHYAAPTMAMTVVPNRNALLLSIAFAAAVSEQAEMVAMAVHAGDHFIYPDCRPGFIAAFAAMQRLAVEGFGHPHLQLVAPFLHSTKQDIVTVGARLGVRFVDTWSCYKGGEQHCGTCGTCDERRRSFELAGVPDPTAYVSPLSCDGETPLVAPRS
jgi:7-cyano-7-deazaguanine synthase